MLGAVETNPISTGSLFPSKQLHRTTVPKLWSVGLCQLSNILLENAQTFLTAPGRSLTSSGDQLYITYHGLMDQSLETNEFSLTFGAQAIASVEGQVLGYLHMSIPW